MTTMPFGKHRDRPLTEVPGSYLRWLLRACDLDVPLRSAVLSELNRRVVTGDDGPPERWPAAGPGPDTGPSRDFLAEIIRVWYRGLVKDFHPDRGGSNEVMQALNEAHNRLKRLAGVN
jgi:hypothetical protein